MTTNVKIHVNGNYRAKVSVIRQSGTESFAVDGDAEGGRERTVSLGHPADANIRVTEEPLTDEMKAARVADAN